jgi:rubrerythrin
MGDAALLALEKAIKFESDGRDYYSNIAKEAKNPFTRLLFESLAADEIDHIRRVREIYEELKDKPGWPSVPAMVARQCCVLDVFEKASMKDGPEPDGDAITAFKKALEMEQAGIAFYRERLDKATCAAEDKFYKALVAEEEHHLKALEQALGELA